MNLKDNDSRSRLHRKNIIMASILLVSCVLCILMTIIFSYVSSQANQRVDSLRGEYGRIAKERDDKYSALAEQVDLLQRKLDTLPDRTAIKTADKVKQAVKEDERK